MLSGRGLCIGLITHPEESYRLWCVVVCDLESSWGGSDPLEGGGALAPRPKKCNFSGSSSADDTVIMYHFRNIEYRSP